MHENGEFHVNFANFLKLFFSWLKILCSQHFFSENNFLTPPWRWKILPSFIQIQSIKLINSPSFQDKPIALSWQKTTQRTFSSLVFKNIVISIEAKVIKVIKIILHKKLFHAIFYCWVLIMLLFFLNLCCEPP